MRGILQGSGWLIVGVVMAMIAWSGLADAALVALDELLTPGWRRLAVGVLLFAACAAVYFRSHWAAALGLVQGRGRQGSPHAARLRDVAGDLELSAHVIADNLLEVVPTPGADGGSLYLDGARAHAAKLPEAIARIRGVAGELDGSNAAE